MLRSLKTAALGMSAQQLNVDNIANNLANVNTTGFKKSSVEFQDLLYENIESGDASKKDGMEKPASIQIGLGNKPVSTFRSFSQGNIEETGNPLDLAIDGQGFFQALLPDGRVGYTRSGILSRNAEGVLTTTSGYVVQPQIQLPADATSINISTTGIVSVTEPGNDVAQEVGQITIANFSNPRGLTPIGENFFVPSAESGVAQEGAPLDGGFGKVLQGYVESSNVNVVQQLVDMIETQRAYEVSSKSITAVDEMMQFISRNL